MVTALSAVIAALVIFILPGAVVAWCAGMRLPWAAATGVAVTAGVWGVLGWAYGAQEIPVTLSSLLLGTAVFAIVGFFWRVIWTAVSVAKGRRQRQLDRELLSPAELEAQQKWWRGENLRSWITSKRRHGGILDPVWLLPLAGVVFGFTLLVQRAMDAIGGAKGGLNSVFQGWDAHWHASVIRFIGEQGVASSVRMGELQNIETHKELFYPTGFHTLAFGLKEFANLSVVEALNVTSVVLPALGLTFSAAFLAWFMVGRRGWVGALAAGLAPVAVAGVFPIFYVEYYTGAWPNLAALSVVGIGAAAMMKVPDRPITVPAAALALAGVGSIHPSAVPIVAVIVGFWWLLWKVFVPSSAGKRTDGIRHEVWLRVRDLLLVVVASAAGLGLMLPQWVIGSGQAGEVSQFNKRQVADYGVAWQRVLELQSRAEHYAPTQWWLTIGAIAGAVILLLWRRSIWAAVTTGLFAAVGAYSLKHFDGPVGTVAGFLSGLNYNSTHRLFSPLALIATALAAVAAAALVRFILGGFLLTPALRRWRESRTVRRSRGWVGITSAVLALIVCIGIAIGLVPWTQTPLENKYRWAVAASRDGRMVGDEEQNAFEWLSHQPGAYDGIIANNSHEGTGWMYPLYGLPSLHRHFLFSKTPKESATTALWWHPDLIGAGLAPEPGSQAALMRQWIPDTAGMKGDRSTYANISDFAARDMNVKYFIISPPSFWAFQKNIDAQVHGLWKSRGLTPVYKSGKTAIFAVNAQLTDEEIQQARESGESQSPDKLPPLPQTDATGSAAEAGEGYGANPLSEDHGGKSKAQKQKFFRPTKWDRELANGDAVAGEKAAPAPEEANSKPGQTEQAKPTAPGAPDQAPHAPVPNAPVPNVPAPNGPAQVAPTPAPVAPVPQAPAQQVPAAPAPGYGVPAPGYYAPAPGFGGAPGVGAPAVPGGGQGLGYYG